MSRPTLSVPNGCFADGGLKMSSGWVANPASPGYGAISGAKIATTTITSTMKAPAVSNGFARIEPSAMRVRLGAAAASITLSAA